VKAQKKGFIMRLAKRILFKKEKNVLYIIRPDKNIKVKLPLALIKLYKTSKDYTEMKTALRDTYKIISQLHYDSKSKKEGLTDNIGYSTVHNAVVEFLALPEFNSESIRIARKITENKKKKTAKKKTAKKKTTKAKTTKKKTAKKKLVKVSKVKK